LSGQADYSLIFSIVYATECREKFNPEMIDTSTQQAAQSLPR